MSVAYSFSKTQRDGSLGESRNGSPGPDNYNPERGLKVVKDQSPEWSFSRSQRQGEGDSNPGPGAYDANQINMKMNVQYSMGSQIRGRQTADLQQLYQIPGPGTYDPPSLNKPPTFSMRGKRADQRPPNMPGPGYYEPDQNQSLLSSQGKTHAMSPFGSKSKRDTVKNQSLMSPGPGAYSPKAEAVKYKNPTFGMGRGQKGITSKDINSGGSSLGPGAYEGVSKEIGKGLGNVSMGSRPRTAKPSQTPGPGAYDQAARTINGQSQSQRGVSALMSRSARMGSLNRDQVQTPGPGAYEANKSVVKDKVINSIFGKVKRQHQIGSWGQAPGPGSYQVPDTKNAKTFTIGGRPQTALKNQNPGPGNYDPNHSYVRDGPRNVKLASSQRQQQSNALLSASKSYSQLPGPGQYDSAKKFGQDVPSFSIRGKPKEKRNDMSPAPGQYDPNEDVIKDRVPTAKLMSGSKRSELAIKSEYNNVGPGQYNDSHKRIGSEVKSFSFRPKPKEQTTLRVPGPGAYEPNPNAVKDSLRNTAISQSKRPDVVPKQMRELPGPGTNGDIDTFGKNAPTFSMQPKREPARRDNTPGPGAYSEANAVVRDKSPSFRMGQSHRVSMVNKEQMMAPGPGNYQVQQEIGSQGPKFSINAKREPKIKDMSPGPGGYDPNPHYTKDALRGFQMSQSQRQTVAVSKEIHPAPGDYGSPARLGFEGPKFTMGGRSQTRAEQKPGPGQYDPDSSVVKDKTPSYAISKTLRSEIVQKQVKELPGPGQYASAQEFGKEVKSFQIRGRPEDQSRLAVPGPGSYQADPNVTKDRVVSHKLSQSQRSQIVTKEMLQQPGPGEYDSPDRFGDGAREVSIRGRPREEQRNMSPGPGNYDPDMTVTKHTAVAFKMSSSKRSEMVAKEFRDLPGPGNYDNLDQIGKSSRCFTIGGKAKDVQDSRVPGPGAYEPNNQLTKDQALSSFKMPQTARADIVAKEDITKPGPGHYDKPHNFGEDAKTFSIRGKPQDRVGNEVPGPGQYDLSQDQVKDRVVGYKMNSNTQRVEFVDKDRPNTPGPGAYESPSKLNDRSFTIGQRVESPLRTEVPGPGAYNQDESAVKHQNPSVRINSATTRSQLVSKEQQYLPGPGNYANDKIFGSDAQSFTIKGKPQDNMRSEVPGPGSYNQDESMVRHLSPSARIDGNTQRASLVSKEQVNLPGPGNYTHEKPFGADVQSFQIRGKPQDKVRSEVPGPGQYNPDESATRYQNPSFKIDNSTSRTQLVSKEQQNLPGPGNYEEQKQFGAEAQTFSIRGKPKEQVRSEVPGPGSYNQDESMIRHQSPGARIDNSTQRVPLVSKEQAYQPGPGNYANDKPFGSDAQAVSIRGRPQENVRNDIPGPGSYNAQADLVKDQALKSFRMPQTKRDFLTVDKDQQQLPGPGQYDLQSSNSGPSFQIRGRDPLSASNGLPGPGAYELSQDQVRHQNPSIDFSRSPDRSKNSSPQRDLNQPGPGAYDARDYNLGGSNSITYSIPKGEPRDPDSGTPGPGHYRIPCKFADTPSYSGIQQNEEFRYV